MTAASLDRAAFWLLAASLGLTQVKLLAAQALFGLAAILWVAIVARGTRPRVPAFFLPLAVYGGLTLVSALASPDRAASLADCKQLLLFLIVPVVMTLARGNRAMQAIDVLIAIGGAVALVGIVQFAMFGYDELSRRPVGFLSHYMTYSGVLMLVTCAAFSRLLFHRREIVWPAVAVPALIVALGATLTRNAWMGTAAAISLLLALRNWKLILVVPVAAAVLFVAAPANVRARAYSIVDPNDPTNRDRFAMMEIGRKVIADHPLFGVGPDRIKAVYAGYRPSYAVNPTNPHLHNVPLQIAAERGLPALAAWLWFLIVAARDLLRLFWRGRHRAAAAAALSGIAAMIVAGLFEYNFGDSEFLMLFLGLITLPFAAESDRASGPAAADLGQGPLRDR